MQYQPTHQKGGEKKDTQSHPKSKIKPFSVLFVLALLSAAILLSGKMLGALREKPLTSSSAPALTAPASSSNDSSSTASRDEEYYAQNAVVSASSEVTTSKPSSAVASSAFVSSNQPASEALKEPPQKSSPSQSEAVGENKKEQAKEQSEAATAPSLINSYDTIAKINPSEQEPLWNLILLNMSHAITSEIPMKRVKYDSQYIDSRVEESYKALCNGAKNEGITLFLRSGYRSIQTQENNYNNAKASYIKQGYTKAQATAYTEQYYTRSGHSEHHSGLALDIITPEYHNEVRSLDERFAQTKAYSWLLENCAEYGFILRYPESKKEITGINFEPWHYRYVGKSHANAIMQNNLCLEEYLFNMETAFLLEQEQSTTDRAAMALFAEEYPSKL